MNSIKRILSLSLALATAFTFIACGKEKKPEVTLPPVSVPDAETTLTKLPEGTTIKWMAPYDLNPSGTQERSAALTLYEDSVGGKIEHITTTDANKFDDLAQLVISNNSPDIFPYHWAAFPGYIAKNVYQPVDDIVDFTQPLWADVKEAADGYTINDKHYIAPLYFDASVFVYYNKTLIEEEGLDDPYELYLDNEWTWDAMSRIMGEYMEQDDPLNPVRKGVNGWFQPHIIQTTGETMVKYENGKFINNINNANIARAQDWLSSLAKNKYVLDGWVGGLEPAFGDGTLLFYVMGDWVSTKDGTKYLDDSIEIGLAPIPRDPNNEKNYSPSNLVAHMWVKGSKANEGVKAWYECNRVVNTEAQYTEVNKEKYLREHPIVTEEMYTLMRDTIDPAKFVQSFDYGYGISTRMSVDNDSLPYEEGKSIMTRLVSDTTKEFEGALKSWTTIRDEFTVAVDNELDILNKELANFKN